MVKKVIVRFIIEIGGKPVENVDKALNLVLNKLKDEKKKFKVLDSHLESPELDDKTTLYMGFIEVSVKFKDTSEILAFILDYTPTSVEIEEPETIELNAQDFTGILNDMSTSVLNLNNKIRQLNAHIHMMKKK